MARALLSDNLGGRDVVPKHVADRVTAQAEEWIEQGFTEETVRAWKDADVSPTAAGYLAERGVEPRVLELPMKIVPNADPVPLRVAIASGRLSVERAYELLVLTGEHVPPSESSQPSPQAEGVPAPHAQATNADTPPAPRRAPRPVAPVIFSHAADS
ncbi:MAG: hypothetical protein DIU79_12980 [Actinobacteria bacterium]|nr:MAG: hypothetical protein DIU79_12980 [Actinomycetota bacterium]